VKQNPRAVRRIPQQTEDEKQQTKPLTRALALILNNLRNPRSKITNRARVPQHRSSKRDGLHIGFVRGLGHPDAAFPGESPARGADGHDAEDAERVLERLGGLGFDVEDGGEGRGAAAAASLAVASVGAGEADVGAVAAAEKGRFDGGGGEGGGFAGVAAGVDGVVVHALGDEDLGREVSVCSRGWCEGGVLSYQVCDAEVHGQRDDGGDQARPERAEEVGHVADEPDGEEDEGDAICRAGLVVLNQLGNLGVLAGVMTVVACVL
jgi:hypothetical protein